MSAPRYDRTRYVTIAQLARRLNVSRQSLYRAEREGRLSCVIQSGNVRGRLVPVAEMRRYEREDLVPVVVA